MNRVLLLCLLLSVNAYGMGTSPFVHTTFAETVFPPIDTVTPTITCPASDTVEALPGACEATYNYTVGVDDDQPNPILIQLSGLASGSSFQLGATANVFLVTDQAGNTATCSFTVTVRHFQTPALCTDLVEIALDQNCTAQISPLQILEEPYGCPSVYTVEIDKVPPFGNGPWLAANLAQSDLGKMYTVRVTDPAAGSSCIGSILVVDTLPPVLNCQDFILPCAVLNTVPAFLKDSLGIDEAIPQVTDGCGGQVTINFLDTYVAEDCSTGFTETIKRRWVAVDASNNTIICMQNIHLAQLQPADIKIPPDITLDCKNPDLSLNNTGSPYIEFEGRNFPITCSVEVDFTDTLVNVCPGSKILFRTWSFLDFCTDKTTDKDQVISVLDNKGPVVTCDTSLIVYVDGANCVGELDLPPVTMSDNCSPVVRVEASWMADATTFSVNGVLGNNGGSATFSTISDFPVYTTTVTYTAKDSCGNTGTCELMLTMADSAAPTAGCFPLIIAQLSADGSYALGADTLDFNSDVACGQQLFYKVRRVESNPACLSSDQYDDTVVFCCADIGDTIDVILRVYDVPIPNGIVAEDYAVSQSSDCSLKVAVVDTLPARCVAPQDVTVSCADFDPTLDSYGILTQSCTVDSLAVSVDYAPFDSGCTKQTILRTFTVLDQNGVGLPCEQHITVNYLQNYYIKFPDDVIITACSSSGVYGEPEFLSEGCGQMEATYTDEVFAVVPDACRKIERTWLVYNSCSYDSTQQPVTVPNPTPNATSNNPQNLPGPIVSPPGTPVPWAATEVKVNPTDLDATDFSIFWDPNARAYKYTQIIKIIDSQKPLYDCPAGPETFGDTSVNHPLLWNQSYWYDPALDSHDLCEGSAPLSITATDSCSGANLTINFLLFLDLDNNGTKETVINSVNPPPAGTVNFNNAANPNYSGGTPSVFDGRPVPPGEIYHFAMHQSVSGITRTAAVQWKTAAQLMTTPNAPYGQPGISPELPYGKHSIKWYVSDECGNEKTCEYNFEIKDTKAPEVQCVNDLTINYTGSPFLEVDVSTFLSDASDNCTPPTPYSFDQNLLAFSLRKSGNGIGFPTDTSDNPVTSLSYICPTDVGPQSGELWVSDLAGNTSFCQFNFTIGDPNNICDPVQGLTVAGNIKTEVNTPVANASVTLSPNNVSQNDTLDITDNQGSFDFQSLVIPGDDYTLTPLKDDDPLNGVSTFDLVVISKHILGLQALNSPYKIIAADANHSGAVTTFDVVEIRKLILGIYNELPANTSWRFVDKDYVFPDTLNPFVPPFPETISRANVTTDQLEDDFIGIKVGDVNNTVQPDSLLVTDDRSAGTLFFHTNDRNVVRGEEFTVGFKASESVSGYQFTLNTNGLEAIDVLPGKDLSPENFGIFPDAVTASVEKDAGEFAITFRAAKSGRLSDMIAVSSRITRAEAYGYSSLSSLKSLKSLGHYGNDEMTNNDEMTKLDVALLFDNILVSKIGFELYQNQPNPFLDKTDITCHLPEETDATLSVFDETGRVLFTQSGHYDRGYHTFQIDRSALDTPGVLYYKLETATDSAVRKMVVIR